MSGAGASICDHLKVQTSELHHAAESMPFIRALVRRQVPLRGYITYLRVLAIIHSALEREIAKSENALLKRVWRDDLRKAAWLNSDIEYLQLIEARRGQGLLDAFSEDGSILDQAVGVADSIKILSVRNPVKLLGYLYVLEGSTNGSIHIYPRLQEAYDLEGIDGARYFRNYGERQASQWAAFKQRLNDAVTRVDDINEITLSAQDFYNALIGILGALSSSNGSKYIHASVINPEAGSHPVPQTELELQAARKASEICLFEMPYVRARYGERGERYTQSDGAWLVTLADFSELVVLKQTKWLGKLLSALGMPRFTLAMHLRETAKALSEVMPEAMGKYQVLIRAAEGLESHCREKLTAAEQADICRTFRAALGNAEKMSYRNLDSILISAVVDERLDRSGSLDRTRDWIETESRWPAVVIGASGKLIQDLRSRLDA